MAEINNVTRMLDAKAIRYRALAIPERKLNAMEVASFLSVPADVVYKTIVVERYKKGKAILAVVQVDREVQLKKLASSVGEKKVQVATLRQAESLTGLRAGGISPLALTQMGFQVVLDAKALDQEEIIISGGQWGLQIALSPLDMIKMTNASFAEIS